MKTLILGLVLALALAYSGQSQTLAWVKQIGGSSRENGYALAVDAAENQYVTGHFAGTLDFDPGPGTFNLTSAGAADIFVTKMDVAGNLVWAKQLGGASPEWGQSIAVDAVGNVYITGSFSGVADFDP